jgi:hypothetical protein
MKSFKENKKAQVTVFIIIGIVLLFTVGIYSYMKSTGVSPATFFQPKTPPVVEFIESCMDKVATEAIKAMGDQGGYIILPMEIGLDPTKHVSLIPGVGGFYAPKVPYWYWDGSSRVPSLKYMQFQMEKYIDINMKYCLRNFEGMRDEFDILEKSNYSSTVLFTDKETVIGLNYMIDIAPKGSNEVDSRDQFLVRIDVPLKRMWELANDLLQAENRDAMFEHMTINLMGSYPPEDIPFTGLTLHCGRLTWLLSDVKKKLINALEPAITGIRFKNTDHPPFMAREDVYRTIKNAVDDSQNSRVFKPLVLPKNIPADSYDYFQYYFNFTEKDYSDLKVMSTFKQGWGMNILATPNQYGVLKSGVQDLKSQIMSFLCLNTYHFVYDLTYPVMISINSPAALHRTGYVFRFAFPVQIFHNNPDRTLLSTAIIEPTEYAKEYCDSLDPRIHTIIARDIITNAELSKVNLTFKCFTQLCALGTTRTNNRHLQWAGKFPEGCFGAIINANRSGYLETEKQHDGSDPFIIPMYPTQAVKFDVRRHTEDSPDVARFLQPDQYAIIQLELRNPPLSIFDVFGSKDTFNRTGTFDILRADATYQLNIMLLQKMSKDEDRLIGGWMGNWTVKLDDILDAKKVVFHVPQKFPPPQTDSDIMGVYEIMTNRTRFPKAVPEIIRADEYTGD